MVERINLGGLGLEDVGKGPRVLSNIRAEASGPVYGPGCFGGSRVSLEREICFLFGWREPAAELQKLPPET